MFLGAYAGWQCINRTSDGDDRCAPWFVGPCFVHLELNLPGAVAVCHLTFFFLCPEDLLRDVWVKDWSAFGYLLSDRDLVDRSSADVLSVMFCGAPGVAMCGTVPSGVYLAHTWRFRDQLSSDESVVALAPIAYRKLFVLDLPGLVFPRPK